MFRSSLSLLDRSVPGIAVRCSEFSGNSMRGTETARAAIDHAATTRPSNIEMSIASPHVRLIFKSFGLLLIGLASAASANEQNAQKIVERVQQETNGKVLSVQTMQIGKRRIYRIKVLTPGGQVRVVEVRADQ